MPVSHSPVEQQLIENIFGHPQDKFVALCERIQHDNVKTFAAVEGEFLDLIWTLDAYRVRGIVPRDMGNPKTTSLSKRLEGIYRGKGNYFSEVMALLLGQRTTSRLEPRSRVWGYSQTHQIDIAWPTRDVKPIRDPLICCEAKLTGAPAYGDTSERGAMADWTNRRKELKFQATDLKLYRQASDTKIENWDYWRSHASPMVYLLWAARLRKRDDISKMIEEARVLRETYSDGVGIYAFRVREDGSGYEPAPYNPGPGGMVTSLDRVLGYISANIAEIMAKNNNKVPDPVIPSEHPGLKAIQEKAQPSS